MAIDTIRQFIESSPVFVRVIAMSAAMWDVDQKTVSNPLSVENLTIIGGPLDWCGTTIQVIVSENLGILINSLLADKLRTDQSMELHS